LQQEDGIMQPALFLRKSVFEEVGFLSENYHFCMDYEFWIRCVEKGIKFVFVDKIFAATRYHIKNKTYGQRGQSYQEVMEMLYERFGYVNHVWLKRYAEYLAEGFDGVIQHSGNSNVLQQSSVEKFYIKLLKAYNTNQMIYQRLMELQHVKVYQDTFRELKKYGIGFSTPCYEIPLAQATAQDRVCYTVGQKRWAFDAKWKSSEIKRTHRFLDNEINNRERDTIIIVGNGPSLSKIDFKLLENQDVILSNNAFLNPELMSYANYYTVVNYLVAEQGYHRINLLDNVKKIIPYWLAYCINANDNTYFIDAVGYPEFSTDIYKNVSWRHTVSFYNMHIAYGLGYNKVLLIGFDHYYKQCSTVNEEDIIYSQDDDDNHFCKDYFKGKKWQAANVDKMEEMYTLAKDAFEKDNREIINCTIGGNLELFKRSTLEAEIHHGTRAMMNYRRITSGCNLVSKNRKVEDNIICGPFEAENKVTISENTIIHSISKHIFRNKIMIDVGAHHGHALMPYAIDGWTIHAFEPDPQNRKFLISQLSAMENVKVNPQAVSNTNASKESFYQSSESSGISSLINFTDSHKEICMVPTITLERYINENGIQHVGLLKIDAEGNDFNVLKGFPWEYFLPEVIIAEFEDKKTERLDYDFYDMAKYIMDRGYELYISEWHPIIKYGIEHSWCRLIKFPSEIISKNSWGNIIAFEKSKMSEELSKRIEKEFKRQAKKNVSNIFVKKLKKFDLRKYSDSKKMKAKQKIRTYYARIAEYLLYKHPELAHIGRFIIRSIKYSLIKCSKSITIIISLISLALAILAYMQGSYLLFTMGITVLCLIALLIALLKYGVYKVYEIIKIVDQNRQQVIQKIDTAMIKHDELKSKLKNSNLKLQNDIDCIQDTFDKWIKQQTDSSKLDRQKLTNLKEELIYYTKGTHQYFNRYLSDDAARKIMHHIDMFDTVKDLNHNSINYLAYHINCIERKCKGRFASNIEDFIVRHFYIKSLKKEKIRILEIGTLFGIQLSIYYNTCRGYFHEIKMVAIDPLDGYYKTNEVDILTYEPVNELIFQHNMRVSDVHHDDILLIKEVSESENAKKMASRYKYDVLIIDGDHRYQAIKNDFLSYRKMVNLHGLIIFDDYLNESWQDVTRYVDDEVSQDNKVKCVFRGYNTAIFKKCVQ
jgi:FkbM family methyltransferase